MKVLVYRTPYKLPCITSNLHHRQHYPIARSLTVLFRWKLNMDERQSRHFTPPFHPLPFPLPVLKMSSRQSEDVFQIVHFRSLVSPFFILLSLNLFISRALSPSSSYHWIFTSQVVIYSIYMSSLKMSLRRLESVWRFVLSSALEFHLLSINLSSSHCLMPFSDFVISSHSLLYIGISSKSLSFIHLITSPVRMISCQSTRNPDLRLCAGYLFLNLQIFQISSSWSSFPPSLLTFSPLSSWVCGGRSFGWRVSLQSRSNGISVSSLFLSISQISVEYQDEEFVSSFTVFFHYSTCERVRAMKRRILSSWLAPNLRSLEDELSAVQSSCFHGPIRACQFPISTRWSSIPNDDVVSIADTALDFPSESNVLQRFYRMRRSDDDEEDDEG